MDLTQRNSLIDQLQEMAPNDEFPATSDVMEANSDSHNGTEVAGVTDEDAQPKSPETPDENSEPEIRLKSPAPFDDPKTRMQWLVKYQRCYNERAANEAAKRTARQKQKKDDEAIVQKVLEEIAYHTEASERKRQSDAASARNAALVESAGHNKMSLSEQQVPQLSEQQQLELEATVEALLAAQRKEQQSQANKLKRKNEKENLEVEMKKTKEGQVKSGTRFVQDAQAVPCKQNDLFSILSTMNLAQVMEDGVPKLVLTSTEPTPPQQGAVFSQAAPRPGSSHAPPEHTDSRPPTAFPQQRLPPFQQPQLPQYGQSQPQFPQPSQFHQFQQPQQPPPTQTNAQLPQQLLQQPSTSQQFPPRPPMQQSPFQAQQFPPRSQPQFAPPPPRAPQQQQQPAPPCPPQLNLQQQQQLQAQLQLLVAAVKAQQQQQQQPQQLPPARPQIPQPQNVPKPPAVSSKMPRTKTTLSPDNSLYELSQQVLDSFNAFRHSKDVPPAEPPKEKSKVKKPAQPAPQAFGSMPEDANAIIQRTLEQRAAGSGWSGGGAGARDLPLSVAGGSQSFSQPGPSTIPNPSSLTPMIAQVISPIADTEVGVVALVQFQFPTPNSKLLQMPGLPMLLQLAQPGTPVRFVPPHQPPPQQPPPPQPSQQPAPTIPTELLYQILLSNLSALPQSSSGGGNAGGK